MKCILASLLIIFIVSCTRHRESLYAIHELPDSLQVPARNVVNTGMVGYEGAVFFLKTHLNDSAISLLSESENPILRAIALNQMTSRPGFNHQQVIMTHLGDTAIVFVLEGEWGIHYRTVTDYMIQNARWKTVAARDSAANELILHYDNQRSAYSVSDILPLRPEYREHLIKMITREREFQGEIDIALYALARYKRKEDIPLIKQVLLEHEPFLSPPTFRLMYDYPDSAYLEVLEGYYPRKFYRIICRERDVSTATGYLDVLASYKADTCAKILTAILDRKPQVPCAADTAYLMEHLLHAIWDNPCPAYLRLRDRIAARMRVILFKDSGNGIPYEQAPLLFPEPAEPVRWWTHSP